MRAFVFLLIVLTAACGSKEPANVGFITRLGTDTVAVETFEFTDNGVIADVIVRVPTLVATRYELTLDEMGGIEQMTVYDVDPNKSFADAQMIMREDTRNGDSLMVAYHQENGTVNVAVPYESGVLPFIEYTHWPFEVALRANPMQAGDSVDVPMIAGRRTLGFLLTINDEGNTVIRHPFRGTMDVVRSDIDGIETLDASATTRKLLVERTENIPIEQIAMQFKKAEENGKVFGELSGAVTQEFEVDGTNFRLEYGSPMARGRELFGGIVSYGERWRTGANRATHIRTSADIRIGDVEVPAGEYTLFTIPEAEGGTLIINNQTGQNGRSYNMEMDLGRTVMNRVVNEDYVETFTITVSDEGTGAALNLLWGNTKYTIPIEL